MYNNTFIFCVLVKRCALSICYIFHIQGSNCSFYLFMHGLCVVYVTGRNLGLWKHNEYKACVLCLYQTFDCAGVTFLWRLYSLLEKRSHLLVHGPELVTVHFLDLFFQIYSSVTFSNNALCYYKYVILSSTCLAIYTFSDSKYIKRRMAWI